MATSGPDGRRRDHRAVTSRALDSSGPVLVLGGTAEGRELATALAVAGRAVISSLAGRVADPRLPAGEVRSGGFGGVHGLAAFIAERQVSAVVDATHPFAARITGNAVAACDVTGTPLLMLRRPAWTPSPEDDWTTVPDLAAAAGAVARRDRETAVLLTVGRQGLEAFAGAPQRFWLRAVDPPTGPRPARCELILARGPFSVDGELELLQRLAIDLLVTKNSGGPMTSAKLTAARRLGLPVLMVDRPALPASAGGRRFDVVPDVPAALAWLTHRHSRR